MDTMKKIVNYVVWLILFWILSDILIYFGINSTYKDIAQKGQTPEGIEIIQVQATSVNGRIKVKVTDKELSNKFLKVDLYSKGEINLGTQYIILDDTDKENEIETYFKISDVKSYEISVVEEMGTSTEGFMDTALSTLTVFGILLKILFI